jgi:hypothetical protein
MRYSKSGTPSLGSGQEWHPQVRPSPYRRMDPSTAIWKSIRGRILARTRGAFLKVPNPPSGRRDDGSHRAKAG